MIPEFDLKSFVTGPWTLDPQGYGWICLMGFLVASACGLVGTFLVLRRMALVGDAISHSLLPGIVIAFLLTHSLSSPWLLVGAMIAGILTTITIEAVHKNSRVKTDAALGIVFTTFFSIGIILVNLFASDVHLDTECILYGEIDYIPFAEPLMIGEQMIGYRPVVQMAIVLFVLVATIILFYKQLIVTAFDSGLARSLGIPVWLYHYGTMAFLSVVIVSAFESVGAILVIAMLIFPSVTASLLTDRLPLILGLNFVFGFLYSLIGLHVALWLESNIAGSMVLVAFGLFCIVWILSPRQGVLRYWLRSRLNTMDEVPRGSA